MCEHLSSFAKSAILRGSEWQYFTRRIWVVVDTRHPWVDPHWALVVNQISEKNIMKQQDLSIPKAEVVALHLIASAMYAIRSRVLLFGYVMALSYSLVLLTEYGPIRVQG